MDKAVNEEILTVTGIIESLLNYSAELNLKNDTLQRMNEMLQSENKHLKMLVGSLTDQMVEEFPILLPLEEIIEFTV